MTGQPAPPAAGDGMAVPAGGRSPRARRCTLGIESGPMRLMGPGGQTMIAQAVARARAAGVPEEQIQRVIEQEGAARGGAVVPAVIAGRLSALARQYQEPASEG